MNHSDFAIPSLEPSVRMNEKYNLIRKLYQDRAAGAVDLNDTVYGATFRPKEALYPRAISLRSFLPLPGLPFIVILLLKFPLPCFSASALL